MRTQSRPEMEDDAARRPSGREWDGEMLVSCTKCGSLAQVVNNRSLPLLLFVDLDRGFWGPLRFLTTG
jgi:hypothetical protein